MSSSDEYRNLPPKMKRLALTSLWLFLGAMIVGNILRPWLGFWPTTILLVLIMVAVLIPVGRAARQERKELEGPPDPSTHRP
jgi:membrane protein implicated in regulation of membrane protease activity